MTQPQQHDPAVLREALVKYYGLKDIQEITAHPRFKTHFETTKDAGAVLYMMAQDTKENQTLEGFYIGEQEFTEEEEVVKDGKKTKVRKVVAKGARIWLPNGSTRGFRDVVIKGEPFYTRVKVSPVTRLVDVITRSEDYAFAKGCEVKVEHHSAPYPTKPIVADAVEKCMDINKKSGTIRGDSGDRPMVLPLRIGTNENDVSYFPAQANPRFGDGGEKLNIVAYDEKGHSVSINVKTANEVADIRRAFFIRNGAEGVEYRRALAGEPIVAVGKLGILFPQEARNFAKDPKAEGATEDGLAVLVEAISNLDKMGAMKTEDVKGRKLMRLNLSKLQMEDGSPVTFVEIEGRQVYSLEQKVQQDGSLTWAAGVHYQSVGKPPWMWCSEKSRDEEGAQTMNKGAGIFFLNRLGGKVSLPDTSPFAALGKQLMLQV